jgi:hypothetical protein
MTAYVREGLCYANERVLAIAETLRGNEEKSPPIEEHRFTEGEDEVCISTVIIAT